MPTRCRPGRWSSSASVATPSEPPWDQVADFEEYTRLYWDAWREPGIRWLLSTVSSSMIFDDHDVHDDWNTSKDWVEEYRQKPWWNERIVGGLVSYWIYQHIGNLSPRELEDDKLYQQVCDADDAGSMLREFAQKADREVGGARWSYCRKIGKTKLIVMDSRAGRVLDPGKRQMVDDNEFEYIESEAEGDHNHLLLATSLPYLLAPGMHSLEAWNEAVCNGAWGKLWARLGEKIRQELDLEHWGAFDRSFHRVRELVERIGSGQNGSDPPASIVFLSGDVHHAYLAGVAFRRDVGMKSKVYQAVCSPFRNPLDSGERRAIKLAGSRPARLDRAPARGRRGRTRPRHPLAVRSGPHVRQPDRHLRVGGRRRLDPHREVGAERAGDAVARDHLRAEGGLAAAGAAKTVARRQTWYWLTSSSAAVSRVRTASARCLSITCQAGWSGWRQDDLADVGVDRREGVGAARFCGGAACSQATAQLALDLAREVAGPCDASLHLGSGLRPARRGGQLGRQAVEDLEMELLAGALGPWVGRAGAAASAGARAATSCRARTRPRRVSVRPICPCAGAGRTGRGCRRGGRRRS